MNPVMTYGIPIGIAVLVSVALNPILIAISHKLGWFEKQNHRTIHKGEIPYIGGVAIFLSFVAAVYITQLFAEESVFASSQMQKRLLLFTGGFLIIHLIGLIDDFVNIRAQYKFLFQLAAAALVSFSGATLTGISVGSAGVLNFGPFSHIITILWLVGMSNAVNFIDGMDGLSGSTSAFAAIFFGVVFIMLGNVQSAILAFALCGAVIGFLVFNWPPAKIFMGDSGALTLGFVLGALPFFENAGMVSIEHMLIPISLLFFPLVDTFTAIGRRLARRTPIHTPDKEHIHHKLLSLGIGHSTILLIVLGIIVFPASSSILVLRLPAPYSFLAVAATWLIAIAFLLLIHRRYRLRRNRSETGDGTTRA